MDTASDGMQVGLNFKEIKSWAELNIHDYNTKQAFLITAYIIYGETDDRITNIETYWKWFKEKWGECLDSIRPNISAYDWSRTFELFYNTWIKRNFNVKDYQFVDEPSVYINLVKKIKV